MCWYWVVTGLHIKQKTDKIIYKEYTLTSARQMVKTLDNKDEVMKGSTYVQNIETWILPEKLKSLKCYHTNLLINLWTDEYVIANE